MAVSPIIEDFAFELFRKLWIKIGSTDYTESAPDYPAVLPDICPEDFCDTLYDIQCISRPFHENLCEYYYDEFAHSRSDFFFFLTMFYPSFNNSFHARIINLAILVAEMGLACARRGNYLFVFSAPLSFAMAVEELCAAYIESIGAEAAIKELGNSSFYRPIRIYLDRMGRSASCRRTIIYRLQLVRCELSGKEGYQDLCEYLNFVTIVGGILDHPRFSSAFLTIKFISSLLFVQSLITISPEISFYLECLVNDILFILNENWRKFVFREIASLCDLDGEEADTFVALYEETVLTEKEEIPPSPDDSFSFFQTNCSDPNPDATCEKQKDDRSIDKRDTAPKSEDQYKTTYLSSLYKLYDIKPKSIESLDMNTDLNPDALGTNQRDEDPSNAIPDAASVCEGLGLNDTLPIGTTSSIQFSHPNYSHIKSNILEVRDAPSTKIPIEGALHLSYKSPETDRQDSKLKCAYEYIDTSSQHIRKKPTDYVNPTPYQSDEASQHAYIALRDGEENYMEVHKFLSKIYKFVNPIPLLGVISQPNCDFKFKRLEKCIDYCEGHSIELNRTDQTEEDLQFSKSKKDDGCTEIYERPLINESSIKGNMDPEHELEGNLSSCQKFPLSMDKETLLAPFESPPSTKNFCPTLDSGLTGKHTASNQPSNMTETSASESQNILKFHKIANQVHPISSEESPSALTSKSFSTVSGVFPKLEDLEIEDVQSNPLMESHAKEEDSLLSQDSTSSLDIFSKKRLISENHIFVNTLENSKLLLDSSELKDKEVAEDTSTSKLQNKGISSMSTFQVKDQGISTKTFTSNLGNEGILDTSDFELINLGRPRTTGDLILINQEISSDSNFFHTRNPNVYEDVCTSKFDDMEMVSSPDSPVSRYDAMGTNFGFEEFELSSTKDIASSSEVCLRFKRVVEIDDVKDLKITVHYNPEIRDEINFCASDSESNNRDTFSIIDDPVLQGDLGEEHAEFEDLGKNLSLNIPMDVGENEKMLLDDCQPPTFDNFAEQYLKLENEKVFEDSYALIKHNENLLKGNVFKEPVTSGPCQLQIVDVYSIKPETFSELETYSETLSMSPTPSVYTKNSRESKIIRNSKNIFYSEFQESTIETEDLDTTEANPQKVKENYRNEQLIDDTTLARLISEKFNLKSCDDANAFCKHGSVPEHLSPKLCREDIPLGSREKTNSDPKQKKASIKNLQEQKSPTKDEQLKSSKTRGDCCKLIESMPGITEGKDKSKKGNKKRQKLTIKEKEQCETKGATVDENDPGEPQITELNAHHMILVMGVPFENPIEQDMRFMDRIKIKSF